MKNFSLENFIFLKRELLLVKKEMSKQTLNKKEFVNDVCNHLKSILDLKTGDIENYNRLVQLIIQKYPQNPNFLHLVSSLVRLGDLELTGKFSSCFLKEKETQIKEDVINLLISNYNPQLTFKNSHGIDFNQKNSNLKIEVLTNNSNFSNHLDYFQSSEDIIKDLQDDNDLYFLVNFLTFREKDIIWNEFQDSNIDNLNYIKVAGCVNRHNKLKKIQLKIKYKNLTFYTDEFEIQNTPHTLFLEYEELKNFREKYNKLIRLYKEDEDEVTTKKIKL